ncbi:hypothetical protein ACRALDRAFT_1076084 [Sodiomyces alcalophilus JCM 7366]|uniref:uncharacterized protein n=1 Tax=Sodiomyces alcalophilus JCM 7366 TaxID=591952 RepID=UPI0039B4B840
MASAEQDPLLLLRQAIASKQPAIPSASADDPVEAPLSKATHLHFPHPQPISVPLSTPTRFISSDRPVDLRSIYFAWLNKDVAIPEYNASANRLNDDLGDLGTVQNLAFVERLDLFTWLEGASEESEHIRPVAGKGKDAAAATAAKAMPSTAASRSGRGTMDPRMAVIYSGERKMGDRNTVLRGIKPTDFSHARKLAAPFMQRRSGSSQSTIMANPALALNHKPPTRRPDPIVLLSPSASSLLRLSNARSFLENGRYTPPDSSSASGTSMLHVSRLIKDVDPSRPMRFILVEGPEQFKPEYWNRVVAVFTTGQAWQFKNYKWSDPHELFRHATGIYVGWRGEPIPESVRNWGHRVLHFGIDRPRREGTVVGAVPGVGEAARFRDKEVVETIWRSIESSMRTKGWTKNSAPMSI